VFRIFLGRRNASRNFKIKYMDLKLKALMGLSDN